LAVPGRGADRVEPDPGVDLAVRQFREFYLGAGGGPAAPDTHLPAPDLRQARRWARALLPNGSWGDIDYASGARSSWPPFGHWTRITELVTAARAEAAGREDRAAELGAAHRAYAFWIAHDFQCPNWWDNEIGIPMAVGRVSLLLGEDLRPAEYAYATGTSLSRYPIARTGQNKVWLAGNTLMLGLLRGDRATIAAATAAIWSEVRVSTDEGIQPDFSFHQHGPQQQFGNYGMAFAVETARWAGIMRGTPWRLPQGQLGVLSQFLLEGENWVCWRGMMDISACGRQLMPGSPREKAATVERVMGQAAGFDGAHEAAYRAFLARDRPGATNDLVGNRYFWRSDYLVHRRPDMAATLKLSSKRVIGAEMVNSENLSGYHLADGALYLYRDSREYEDIFPVWDWGMLPGVTCARVPPPAYTVSSVKTDFVGGVSDGTAGLCALDYDRDGVRAKKAWFFAGDTVVCLGAGISAAAGTPVATTLNQCLLRGPVRVVSRGGDATVEAGRHSFAGRSVVEHDGLRYSLLEEGALNLETGPVTGSWRRVFDSPATPKAEVTRAVFKLWIDHGRGASGGHYAYAVSTLPDGSKPVVLENSGLRQAVLIAGAGAAIVFWAPGEIELPDGMSLAADEPCLVLAGPTETLVVDPTQRLPRLSLEIDGAAHEVELPGGALAGTPARVPNGP